MTAFTQPISAQIWDMKYRLKTIDGTPIDNTVQDTWRRIARALAEPEGIDGAGGIWEDRFYAALEDFKFVPAGRIVAGAGTDRNVTLSNCFTMGTIPDSLPGIFEHLREAALTMQQGGGIGYDFSTIRPKGAPVKGVAADASGPLSFMDVWDSMCRTIMSAGSRRGAMMATMRCDHPDIEDFIDAKKDPARLRMFNLSVLVTDEFMDAVKHGHNWRLHFEDRHGVTMIEKIVDARELWNKIMRSTYEYAEPGVIFIDRVNKDHNLNYIETVATTNPCGEKPMGPYASCLLGSINLAKLVRNPFGRQAGIDGKELADLVTVAIRMMDNVVDVGKFPLPQQLEKAKADRQLGLGVTGLADALIMCGLKYGSPEAVERTEKWMKVVNGAAYLASIELAKEKGAFPNFDKEKFLASGFMQRMPQAVRERVAKDGIRNALLTSIAPTGTISLYAGNVSSGIEPVFAGSYTRKVLQPDGTRTEERVLDYALQVWEAMAKDRPEDDPVLPPAYVDAQTLDPMAHVRMQAAAQRWVDSSISKTINVPEDISFDEFKDVYLAAYESGCKGCTTYRPNEVTGSVLSVDPKPVEKKAGTPVEKPVLLAPAPRPDVLEGRVYKMKWPSSAHSIYVTITDIVEDGQRRPFEVFVNSKDPSHFAWTVGLTRMISAIFRRPHDSRFVVEELKAVFDPKGGAWMNGQYVPSILAALGHVIERHMKTIGYIESGEELTKDDTEAVIETVAAPGATCPSCGSYNVVAQSGCLVCKDCGHSNCG